MLIRQGLIELSVCPQDDLSFQLKLGVVPVLRSLLSLPDLVLETSPCPSLDGFTREAVTALLTFVYRGSVGELGDKLTSNVNIICY